MLVRNLDYLSIPKEFKKDSNLSNAYKQIGNSVVIPMIEEVARQIIKQIFEEEQDG